MRIAHRWFQPSFIITALVAASTSLAQVPSGLVDLNTVGREQLLELPHMTAKTVDALIAARPFASIVALHAQLIDGGLSVEQTEELYRKAFVHANLNSASREELMLIPGAGKKMAHELEEYRPWKSWVQFDKEIGKYVGADETARLKQYVFMPINLNTASDADLLTIPGLGKKMLHELKEYRPWKAQAQFEKEIGKYVGEKETARIWRYVVIE